MTETPEDRPSEVQNLIDKHNLTPAQTSEEEKASAPRRGHSRWVTTKARVRQRREEALARADSAAADDSDVEDVPTVVFSGGDLPPEKLDALGPAIVKDVTENGWPRYRRRQEEDLEAERQRLLANGGVEDGGIVFVSPEARDAFHEFLAADDPAANLIERIERNKEGIAATVEPITAAEIRDVLAIVDGPVYPANEELSKTAVIECSGLEQQLWDEMAEDHAEGGASSNIDPPGGYGIPDEVKAYINREVENLNDFAAVDFADLLAAMNADNLGAFEGALEDLGIQTITEGVDLAWRQADARISDRMTAGADPDLLEGSSLDDPQARAIRSQTPPEAIAVFADKMAGLQAMSDGDESSVLDAVRDVVLKQAIAALSAHGYLVVKRGMELPDDRRAEVEELLRPRNLLWSNRYHMWWLPDAKGYTPDRDKAGRYRDSEAIEHYRRSARSMDTPNASGIHIPATIIIPV